MKQCPYETNYIYGTVRIHNIGLGYRQKEHIYNGIDTRRLHYEYYCQALDTDCTLFQYPKSLLLENLT